MKSTIFIMFIAIFNNDDILEKKEVSSCKISVTQL
jgi:hypothetical protein